MSWLPNSAYRVVDLARTLAALRRDELEPERRVERLFRVGRKGRAGEAEPTKLEPPPPRHLRELADMTGRAGGPDERPCTLVGWCASG